MRWLISQCFGMRWRGLAWQLVLMYCWNRGVTACPGSVDKGGSCFYVRWLWRDPAGLQPLQPLIPWIWAGRQCGQNFRSILCSGYAFPPTVLLCRLAGFGAPEQEEGRGTSRIQSYVGFHDGISDVALTKISTQFCRNVCAYCPCQNKLQESQQYTSKGLPPTSCPSVSVPQGSGICEWVSRPLLRNRVMGDKILMASHGRQAVFLPEMETESGFVPSFSTWREQAERECSLPANTGKCS